MENREMVMAQLAKRLNLTSLEEEYILTKEEEEEALNYEIEQQKKLQAWKLRQQGFSEQEILLKLSQVHTTIEPEEILKSRNSIKQQNIWHQQQREKEKQEETEKYAALKKDYCAENMFKLMKWASQNTFEKRLIVNDDNKHLITAICYFLSEDERFETDLKYSFKKGLLIRGISGLGKTHLVRCVEKNQLNPILVLSMLEITDEIKSEGEYELRLGTNKIVYLDDVGTEEPTVNHYGTKISFFKNFIELVYLKNQNKTFNKLMISTNNSFSEIEEKYGFRVRSRVKDMFNIIDVKGKDMRG